MARLISASINLSLIDKRKIVEGKNGKYYKITIAVNDNQDKFGNDVNIQQSQSKEEREAKASKVYLGNGKTFWQNDKPKSQYTTQEDLQDENNNPTDLPF